MLQKILAGAHADNLLEPRPRRLQIREHELLRHGSRPDSLLRRDKAPARLFDQRNVTHV